MTALHENNTVRIGDMGTSDTSNLTLRDCSRGTQVLIDDIDLDERHRFRLCEIGLAPGASLRVVQRGMFGGRVIAFGAERIALDGDTTRAIHIRLSNDGANQAGTSAGNDATENGRNGNR